MEQINSNRFKLRYWIIGGYSIPIILVFFSSFFILNDVNKMRESTNYLQESYNIEETINKFSLSVVLSLKAHQIYLLDPNSEAQERYNELMQQYKGYQTELNRLITDATRQPILAELNDLLSRMEQNNQRINQSVEAGNLELALQQWRGANIRSISDRVEVLLDTLSTSEHETVLEAQELQQARLDILQNTAGLLSIISLLGTVAVGWFLIHRLIHRISSEANTIATSSVEITATIEEQESIAAQQAASVNQTTATIEELSTSSQQSAEQAEAAAKAARHILVRANGKDLASGDLINDKDNLDAKSQQIVKQVLDLTEQLGRVNEFTEVVRDIASQTNMLALNAAVEAVRAGEAGKGFGVVATEIRKLADQSRQSAVSITQILQSVQTTAYSTVEVTKDGTKAVDDIVEGINAIALNVEQISLTARQQATATEQVRLAMDDINLGAQQTATGIAQTRIGVRSLQETANNLKTLV
ncbi:methyl-accepting chemotaxis protein [Spirulina subsalsa]|uniref:methyl-accepting chemotaxis protein n=1 Tax=Spirulina subsalsa TaxID=54311 RepID=UPI0002EAD5EE|nr:methyl-accepting chemotaxis protein [Spirulina subsalsa]